MRFVEKQRAKTDAKQTKEAELFAKKRAAEQFFLDLWPALNMFIRTFFDRNGYQNCKEEIESLDRKHLLFESDGLSPIEVTFDLDEYFTICFNVDEQRLGKIFVTAQPNDQVPLFIPLRENESLTLARAMPLADAIDAMFLRKS